MIEANNYIYCSKCGKENFKDAKFCINCGNKLSTTEDTIKSTTESVKDVIKNNETYKRFTDNSYNESCKADFNNNDMINFIQTKVEYYIPKFKEIQELYKSTSWNWAAFFFNSWWFLYRKMYTIGFGIIIGEMILGAIIPSLSLLINICVAVVSGLYGNIVYLKHIQQELDGMNNMDTDIKERMIIGKGGVNRVIIIVAIVVLVFFLFIGVLGALMFNSLYFY